MSSGIFGADEEIAIVELDEGDVVRHPLVATILAAYRRAR